MTTKQSGGKITGLLALTMEAQESIDFNDPIHVIGDYEVEKADGTRPVLGYASVINRGRVGNAFGTSVNNAVVPGDITVEARGLMVVEVEAGAPIEAGREVAVGADSKHYANVGGGTPTNEVQVITEGGSGLTSFTLTLPGTGGGTTGSIAAAATAATVQTALEALFGEGNVAVSGSAGGPYTVNFKGDRAGEDVPTLTAAATGGSGTVTVSTSTAGAGTTLAYVGLALTAAVEAGDLIDVLVR